QARLLDRVRVRTRGTPDERAAYHSLCRLLNADIFRRRREMAEQYLQEHQRQLVNPGFQIDPNTGLGVCQLAGSPLFAEALAEARVASVPPDRVVPSKGSLDFLFASSDMDRDSAISRLALDPNIVGPIARYFGCLPILFSFDINRARNEKTTPNSSQMYHLDP